MDKFYSSPLLNKVEPVQIRGKLKTAFYTEVNTNILVGSNVFIVNGNYDSNQINKINRYGRYVDGWRVLSSQNNKIVLDIDWSGILPFNDDPISNFIEVWTIDTQKDIDYFNTINIDSYRTVYSKFEFGLTNTILFSKINSLSFGMTASNFYSKQGSSYVNINSYVDNGFSGYFLPDYINSSNVNNNRLKIKWNDFSYKGATYSSEVIYEFSDNNWSEDLKYKKAYLSKLNLRGGNFNGTWNDGIWGSYDDRLVFNGSVWNSGIFLNSNWISGTLNSKSSQNEHTTYCSLDQNGRVSTYSDNSNNKGNGFNFFIDSTLTTGIINNGNFKNSKIGDISLYSFSSIDYYYGALNTYDINIYGGFFDNVSFYNSNINNSKIKDSRLHNSYVERSELIDCDIDESAVSGELQPGNITIQSADIWGYIPGTMSSNMNNSYGVVKLYLNDDDFLKFRPFDFIYTTELDKGFIFNQLTEDQRIKLPYETRWVFDKYKNGEITDDEITISFKRRNENKWKSIVILDRSNYYRYTYINNILDQNGDFLNSIDINFGNFLSHHFYSNNQFVSISTSIFDGSVNVGITASIPTTNTVDTRIGFNIGLRRLDTSDFNISGEFYIPAGETFSYSVFTKEDENYYLLDTSTYSISYTIDGKIIDYEVNNLGIIFSDPLPTTTTTTTTTSTSTTTTTTTSTTSTTTSSSILPDYISLGTFYSISSGSQNNSSRCNAFISSSPPDVEYFSFNVSQSDFYQNPVGKTLYRLDENFGHVALGTGNVVTNFGCRYYLEAGIVQSIWSCTLNGECNVSNI